MSENVTDADRKTALRVIRALAFIPSGHDMSPEAEVVAKALAAEREKARAPFLALADELEKKSDDLWQAYKRGSLDDPRRGSDRVGGQIDTLDGVIDRIRRAAEEGQQ